MILRLLFLSLLLIGPLAYGQVDVGVKLGVNLSTTVSDLEVLEQDGLKRGYYGGIVGKVQLTDKRFIKTEIMYSEKGAKYKPSPLSPNGAVGTFKYVSVTWFHGYNPVEKLSLVIGPQVGYLLSAYSKKGNEYINIKNHYNKYDISADLGIGYQLVPNLELEARYCYGFKVMSEHYDRDVNGNRIGPRKFDGAHRIFQLGINYKITQLKSKRERETAN